MENKEKLSYDKALDICIKYIDEIRKKEKLMDFCEREGFAYTAFVTLFNKKAKYKQPKTIIKMLGLMGKDAEIVKEYYFIMKDKKTE
jgi:hypothetical protein